MSVKDDAQFFDRIATLKYRRAKRHDYHCIQLVAPYDGKTFPPDSAFFEVQCQNISTGGISLYLASEPAHQQLLLALSGPDQVVHYIAARIIYCREGFWNGIRQYLVGCEYTRKLSRPKPADCPADPPEG